jgi:uncharacterized phage infection (PIP) family protein YhgE
VRNLAMRSADAAKNTANLIEESVRNAEGGVTLNAEVLRNLTEINEQVNKVSEVMIEIAASSDQQSQGIIQINAAVDQMNQVTQQNAANSEESAAAADELSSQANGLWSTVSMYTLSSGGVGAGPQAPRSSGSQRANGAAPPAPSRPRARAVVPATNGHARRQSDARQAIPFDDDTDEEVLQSF